MNEEASEPTDWHPILIKRATLDRWTVAVAERENSCPTCGQVIPKARKPT
jgi:hypothetical protein